MVSEYTTLPSSPLVPYPWPFKSPTSQFTAEVLNLQFTILRPFTLSSCKWHLLFTFELKLLICVSYVTPVQYYQTISIHYLVCTQISYFT